MSPALKQLFRDVRRSPIGQCVSPAVPYQHRCAIVLRKWKALEELGLGRLRREPDTGMAATITAFRDAWKAYVHSRR